MSTYYSEDINYDIDRYLRDQDDHTGLPICCECENPIYDEQYIINGESYCPDCIESHRIPVTVEG